MIAATGIAKTPNCPRLTLRLRSISRNRTVDHTNQGVQSTKSVRQSLEHGGSSVDSGAVGRRYRPA